MKRNVLSKSLSILLVLCMALALLPGTALAADGISVTVTQTEIRADTVANTEGYGSLTINGNWDDEEYSLWFLETDEAPAGLVNPQIALVDRSGNFVFPYLENTDEYQRVRSYEYHDGIVSLIFSQDSAYYDEGLPEYYLLDGTKAFPLEETTRTETEGDVVRTIKTSYVGGLMMGGYAVIAEMTTTSESNAGASDGAGDGSVVGSNGNAEGFPVPKYYIIDKTGTVTCELPEAFNTVDMRWALGFSTELYFLRQVCGEGLFDFFGINGLEGYMDVTGKTVIDLDGRGFLGCGLFSHGLAFVMDENGLWGCIDKTGTLVIPCIYEACLSFSDDGLATVQKDGKWGYIDAEGNTVIPFEYDDAYGAGSGLAAVGKNGKFGLVDYDNNVVVPLEYDDISSFTDGVAYAVKDGMLYIITVDGSDVPDAPEAPDATVVLSPQKLTVDGESVDCEKYNIDGSNYFKLRDLAALLNGTGSQFEVGYDEATATVSITTGEAYTAIGTELAAGTDNSATAQPSRQTILINGEERDGLSAYNIGGSNFFKLRELGEALGFEVDYDQATNTAIVRSAQ